MREGEGIVILDASSSGLSASLCLLDVERYDFPNLANCRDQGQGYMWT